MPTVLFEGVVDAYAHCRDPRCRGYTQEQVKGQKKTVATTYLEQGGDAPGFEKSHDDLTFASEKDRDCPECSKDREITSSPRPEYTRSSGQDPMMLLHIGQTDGKVRDLEHETALAAERHKTEMAEMKAQLAQQQALLERIAAQGKPADEKPKAA